MAKLRPIIKKTREKTRKTMMYASDSSFFAAMTMVPRVNTTVFRGMRQAFFTKTIGLIRRSLVFDGKSILFIDIRMGFSSQGRILFSESMIFSTNGRAKWYTP